MNRSMNPPPASPIYEIISQKIFNLTNEGFPNQQHWLNLDYLKVNGEYIPHSRAVVQHHMTTEGLSLIQLEYRWRKHFIDNMKPRFCKSLNKNSEMFNLGFCLICGLLTIKLRGWMWKWRSRGSTWCSTSWPKRGALWTLRSTGRKAMRNLVWILTINVKNVILPCQSCCAIKVTMTSFSYRLWWWKNGSLPWRSRNWGLWIRRGLKIMSWLNV